MDFKDIINSMVGRNEEGKPKSAIVLSTAIADMETDEVRNEDVMTVHNPIINFESRGDYIQIDLIFKSYVDIELRALWAKLEKYGKELSEKDEASMEEPIASLTIVPLCYDGEYYATAISPLFWVLQPETPGTQSNMIRMLFYDDNFTLYEADNINIEELKADVDREIANEEYMNAMRNKKELEHEQYLEERNQKIEAARRQFEK